jgi:PKD domain
MRHTRLIALAATAAGVLAAAPAAGAQTFCVNLNPCISGTQKDTIQDALVAAQSNGAEDLVKIGPKSTPYVGSATYSSAEKVTIRGAGRDETQLSAGSGAAITMVVLSPASRVEDLTLNVKDNVGSRGLRTNATGSNIRVVYSGALTDIGGVRLEDAGAIEDSLIDVDHGSAIDRSGLGGAAVRDTEIVSGGSGIQALTTGADVSLRRVKITSTRAPLFLSGSNTLTDVVARMTGSAMDYGVYAGPSSSVVAHHLTLVGGTSGTALSAYATNGTTSQITVRNSIIQGFSRAYGRQGDGTGVANIGISYSRVAPVNTSEAGGGAITQGAGMTAAPPSFVNAAAGDFRLRGDSALIDAGDTQNVLSPDFDGIARAIDGDGAGGARVDMGAYEYRRRAPSIAISAPSTLAIGAAGLFGAMADDPDGDPVTVGWSFGDGATATGPNVQHAFTEPGIKTVVATATDVAGRTASASAPVDVPAPPPVDNPPVDNPPVQNPPVENPPVENPPVQNPPTQNPPAKDRLAPIFTSLSATKKEVTFSLSEPAKVSVRVERAKGKRWIKVKTATTAQAAGKRAVSLKKLKLGKGSYRVTVTAVDAAGNKSKARTIRFRVT